MKAFWITTLALGVGLALARPAAALPSANMEEPDTTATEASLIAQGAKVYAAQCGRCHNMRSSAERTDAQWEVIVSHMRARANLTRSEAEAVKAFLQATNVDRPTASAGGEGEAVAEAGVGIPPRELLALLPGLRAP